MNIIALFRLILLINIIIIHEIFKKCSRFCDQNCYFDFNKDKKICKTSITKEKLSEG